MKIKTGLKAGSNVIDSTQRAIGNAAGYVSAFVNKAGNQAGSLADQAGSTWRSLTEK